MTAPPARIAWTSEIGASERAATWASQATAASAQPAANQREPARSRRPASFLEPETEAASWQPRCFRSEARFVATATSTASPIPISIVV